MEYFIVYLLISFIATFLFCSFITENKSKPIPGLYIDKFSGHIWRLPEDESGELDCYMLNIHRFSDKLPKETRCNMYKDHNQIIKFVDNEWFTTNSEMVNENMAG